MSTYSPYLDYFLFILVASIGTLQIAAAYAQNDQMLFFKKPIIGYITGSLAILSAFCWFFATDERIGHNYIAGSQQFGLFISGVTGAILVTLALSFVIRYMKTSLVVKFQNITFHKTSNDCSRKSKKG